MFLKFCENGLGRGCVRLVRKYIVALALGIVLAVVVAAGCGSSTSSSSTSSSSPGTSGTKEVNLLSWGGTIQQTFEQKGWSAKFEQETGYKLVFTPKDTSSQIIAQIAAQKGNPQYDVIMCSEGPLSIAADQGLFATLDKSSSANLADMTPSANHGNYVDVYADSAALLYNPAYFKQNGLAAPNSWADLLNPRFKGKIMIPAIDNTEGLFTFVEMANLGGGGINNITPGYAKLKQLAPLVSTWPENMTAFEQGFHSGETVLAVDDWVDGVTMMRKGLPIKLVIPKEGAYADSAAAAIVANSPNPQGAQALLNFLIGQEFLKYQSDTYGKGSYNTKVVVDPAAAPYTLSVEMVSKLKVLDWKVVTPELPTWTQQWDQITAGS